MSLFDKNIWESDYAERERDHRDPHCIGIPEYWLPGRTQAGCLMDIFLILAREIQVFVQ